MKKKVLFSLFGMLALVGFSFAASSYGDTAQDFAKWYMKVNHAKYEVDPADFEEAEYYWNLWDTWCGSDCDRTPGSEAGIVANWTPVNDATNEINTTWGTSYTWGKVNQNAKAAYEKIAAAKDAADAAAKDAEGRFATIYGKDAAKVKKWYDTSDPEELAKLMGYNDGLSATKANALRAKILGYVYDLDKINLEKEQYTVTMIKVSQEHGREACNFIACDSYWNGIKFGAAKGFSDGEITCKDEKTLAKALEDYDKIPMENNKSPEDYLRGLHDALVYQHAAAVLIDRYAKLGGEGANYGDFTLMPWYTADAATSDWAYLRDFKKAWEDLEPAGEGNPSYDWIYQLISGKLELFLNVAEEMETAVNWLTDNNYYFENGRLRNLSDIKAGDCKNLGAIKKDADAKKNKFITEVYEPGLTNQWNKAVDMYKDAYPDAKAQELAKKFVQKYQNLANEPILLTTARNKKDYTNDNYLTSATECQLDNIVAALEEYDGLYNAQANTTNVGALKYNDLDNDPWAKNYEELGGSASSIAVGQKVKVQLNSAAVNGVNVNGRVVDDKNQNQVYATLLALKKTAMIDNYGTIAATVYTNMYAEIIAKTTYQTAETMITKKDLQTLNDAIQNYNKIWADGVTDDFKQARIDAGIGTFKYYNWSNSERKIMQEMPKAAFTTEAADKDGITPTGTLIKNNAIEKIDSFMYGGRINCYVQEAHANKDVKNGVIDKKNPKSELTYGTLAAKLAAAGWMATWEDYDTKKELVDGSTLHWNIIKTRENVLNGFAIDKIDKDCLTKAKKAYGKLSDEAKEYIDSAYYFTALKDILPVTVTRVEYYSHCFEGAPKVYEGDDLPISLNAVVATLNEWRVKELNLSKQAGANPVAVLYGPNLERKNFVGYEDVLLPANVILCRNNSDAATNNDAATLKCTADLIKLDMNAPYKVYCDIDAANVVVSRKYAEDGKRECLFLPFEVKNENFDNLENEMELYAIGGAYVNDRAEKPTIAFGMSAKGGNGDRFLAAYKPYITVAETVKDLEFKDVTIKKTEGAIDSVKVNAANRATFNFFSSNDDIIVNVGDYYLYGDKLNKRNYKKDENGNYIIKANPTTAPAGTLVVTVEDGTHDYYTIGFEGDFDEATGIEDVNAAAIQSDAIYNINGQKVNTMNRPGIYVVNGKKVSVK